jgi:hypothetical protein
VVVVSAEAASVLPDEDDGGGQPRPFILGLISGPVVRVDPSSEAAKAITDPMVEGWPVEGLQDGLHYASSVSEVLSEAFDLLIGVAWIEDGRVVGASWNRNEEMIVLIRDGKLAGGLVFEGAHAKWHQVAKTYRNLGFGKQVWEEGKKVRPEMKCRASIGRGAVQTAAGY